MPKLSEVFAHLEAGGHIRKPSTFNTLNLSQVLSKLRPCADEEYGCCVVNQEIELGELEEYCLVPAPPMQETYTFHGITNDTLSFLKTQVESRKKADKVFTVTLKEVEE